MYCPVHFSENRPEVLHKLIAENPLATVIYTHETGLVADHIPLQFVPKAGNFGKFIGHVARPNPLWQSDLDQKILVIFQGGSHYISPNGYASKAEHGKVVPTWNYAVVHAECTLRTEHDPQKILEILENLTNQHELTQNHPWKVSDAPRDFTVNLLKNIVGLELVIHKIEGKWKVSQNQPKANQVSLIQALRSEGNQSATNMADLIQNL